MVLQLKCSGHSTENLVEKADFQHPPQLWFCGLERGTEVRAYSLKMDFCCKSDKSSYSHTVRNVPQSHPSFWDGKRGSARRSAVPKTTQPARFRGSPSAETLPQNYTSFSRSKHRMIFNVFSHIANYSRSWQMEYQFTLSLGLLIRTGIH